MPPPLINPDPSRAPAHLVRGGSVPTTLAVVARELAAADTHSDLMDRLMAVVPTLFSTADRSGVVMGTATGLASVAATDDVARRLDQEQVDLSEGPIAQVVHGDGDPVLMVDIAREQRWPTWRAALPPDRVGSCLSLRLDAGRGSIGALTLYAAAPHAFPADMVSSARALALHTSAAAATVSRRDNLRTALDTRDVIGQAKGVLMERHRVTADEAFQVLVAASQRTNRKLRDVADELTRTGELTLKRRAG